MALSRELVSEFIKVTNDKVETKQETTVYGTIVEHEGSKYVKLDGSDLLTPISSTTDVEADERVTVMIKNHTAIVTGNMSSPAARTETVQEIGTRITEAETLIADKVSVKELDAVNARIENLVAEDVTINGKLTANEARIEELVAENVTINGTLTAQDAKIESLETGKLSATDADIKYATIGSLNATNAQIHNLEADYGDFKVLTTDTLEANEASIKKLDTEKLSANEAKITYATISNLNATNANIGNLEADYGDFKDLTTENLTAANASINDLKANKLSVKDAEITYANIDFSNIGEAAMRYFYAESGLIKDVVINNGTITGNLVGVTIKGDLIEGGTVVADKLVIKGTDGLYYKLNTDGMKTETEQTDYNSLNGSIITAKSITATKISVEDLVAFGATIGGFHITTNSIYSGVKTSVSNTTAGIYLDNTGQIAFGNASKYVKFYKNSSGNYVLEIAADSLLFGASKTSVETAISEAQDEAESAKSIANTASANASAAQTAASQAKTDAASAKSTANTASTTASAAQTAANEAKADAEDAQTAASQAKTDAASAKNTASTASATATAAQTTANQAKTSAENAQSTADQAKADAATAQSGVNSLTTRVTSAETKISQNTDAIALRATKTEVEETLDGYYNKTETDAAIKVSSDNITSAVSATYATKTSLNNVSSNVTSLTTRVTSAETKISQNTDAIALRATKTEVSESLKNHYTKTETDAAIKVSSDNITSTVSATYATQASLDETNQAITDQSSDIASDINDVIKMVETKTTSESVSIQIQTAMANGANKVITSTGYTLDEDGLSVNKSGSEMTTQITEDGMTVYKNENAVLKANNSGVDAINLHATTYLIIGNNSRFEDYGDRTACFWIGN